MGNVVFLLIETEEDTVVDTRVFGSEADAMAAFEERVAEVFDIYSDDEEMLEWFDVITDNFAQVDHWRLEVIDAEVE